MNKEPICPICKHNLHCGAQLDLGGEVMPLYQCANPECEETKYFVGSKTIWEYLRDWILKEQWLS